jgi:uncharacterized protein (TIGR01370 family)
LAQPRLILLLAALLLAALPVGAADRAPSIAFFYAANPPLDELRAFDLVVVEPDHGHDPAAFRASGNELFAYVSVGETHPTRPYFADLPAAWKLATNPAWGSVVIDQSAAEWPRFFADKVVAPLWQRGYRGLFLDTLDSYRLAGKDIDAARQQQGLVAVIRELRARFPGIRLIANRGFEFLPAVRGELIAVAAESLFRGWDAATGRYVEVPEADRAWLLGQLRRARDELGLPVIAIDYVAPAERALARETAQRIRALGITPWVADPQLASLGVGAVEVMPRRIALLYDGRESGSPNDALVHRYAALPLEHLGYVPEYIDIARPLPQLVPGRYAGIVTWFGGGIAGAQAQTLAAWLQARRAEGLPVAVLGDFGVALDAAAARTLGLTLEPAAPSGRLAVASADPMFGFEAPPRPESRHALALRAAGEGMTALLTLRDARGVSFDAAALTPWGGYVSNPFALVETPGVEGQNRWVVDPFAFFRRALRLEPMPVPDTTTGNGRRLFFAHIDGDGFPSRAEFPGSPLAAAVLLREVLERYRVPHAMSVIEAEVSPAGLHPALAPEMEDLARRMFALPHVEIATHTFSHPFNWAKAEAGANPDDPDAYYALSVPGYRISIEREIAGSADYIRRRLAPPGKPVSLLLWSGDAAPGAVSLRQAARAGLANLNGGWTTITREQPTLSAVSPLGIAKEGHWQTYAPVMNENLYTNLWRGPFYGFRRVIETFRMTGEPRRLKPISIYYHTYSASKPAALSALREVYDWALRQPIHPIYPSEFVRIAEDFNRMTIARVTGEPGRWQIRGDGALRTLRLPRALGMADIAASTGVAGDAPADDGSYVHLAGGRALLASAARPASAPRLAEANGRIGAWQTDARGFTLGLAGHVPLEFALREAAACRATIAGKPLVPWKTEGAVTHYRLRDAATTIQAACRQR